MAPHLAAAKAGAGALAILEDPLSLGQWNEVVMRVSRCGYPPCMVMASSPRQESTIMIRADDTIE
jgi:hypothetical protein